MSVPLDRLYHYIQEVAEQVHGDCVLIYRFNPHGSKNIEDLSVLNPIQTAVSPQLFCYDQEPLDYEYYQKNTHPKNPAAIPPKQLFNYDLILPAGINLRFDPYNVYDKCLLLHSEKKSIEVEKYNNSHFISVYYWAHAVIAQDWFRYAKYIDIQAGRAQKHFLIYNRAWAGTREYRLKFVELLQQNDLINDCKTSFNPVDPEHSIHYTEHVFKNIAFKPNGIKNNIPTTAAPNSSSADFEIEDYANTKFEVVLETLFDDSRIQLTEKALRPIACGHPFILASTPGSLAYLRDYGFKTFNGIIDESYDFENDPVKRLQMIIVEMKKITRWTEEEQEHYWNKIKQITAYNKQHFFSEQFEKLIVDELTQNLKIALDELELTNTGKSYIEYRKKWNKDLRHNISWQNYRKSNTKALLSSLLKARSYYRRYLKTSG